MIIVPVVKPPFPFPQCRSETPKSVFVDDTTILEVVSLPTATVPLYPINDPTCAISSSRLGIPASQLALSHILGDIGKSSEYLEMVLNMKKTSVMMITFSQTHKAVPYVNVPNGDPLRIDDQIRLLGVLLDSKMTFWPLVEDLCSRSGKRMWGLLRLRDNGGTVSMLKTAYIMHILSLLEYCACVWSSCLNGVQTLKLESIQRRCLQIVLGSKSGSYEENLTFLQLDRLQDRWEQLQHRFAIRMVRNPRFSKFFTPTPTQEKPSRTAPPRFVVPVILHHRSERNPLRIITEFLNTLSEDEIGSLPDALSPNPQPALLPGLI